MGTLTGPLGSLTLASPAGGIGEARLIGAHNATFKRNPGAAIARGNVAAGPWFNDNAGNRPSTPSGSLRMAAMKTLSSSTMAASSSTRQPPLAGSQRLQSNVFGLGPRSHSTPAMIPLIRQENQAKSKWGKDTRRRCLELLADPQIAKAAKEIFEAHDKDRSKNLSLSEFYDMLHTLHLDLDIPAPDNKMVEQLFKKHDIDCTGDITFKQFLDFFKAELRRCAFDRSSVIRREFFITKKTQKIWDIYERTKELGSGTFGTAYLAKRKDTGERRVVKAVLKSRAHLPLEDIEKEILIMRQVDHPHIVRLFEWYEDGSRIYLVLDHLKGGTLQDVVLSLQKQNQGLKEAWIRNVICQVVQAMAYCHELRLIHKDLKDENIMLLKKDPSFAEPFVVIIDLGIAEMFSVADPSGRELGGTPTTMAPEVWMGNFGPKCDVYSVGVIFFELLSGTMPFMARSLIPSAWLREHRKGPDWNLVNTSEASKGLCKLMLTYSERERPTMKECAQHEYFSTDRAQMGLVPPSLFTGLADFCKQQQVKRALLLEIASRLPMDQAAKIVSIFESLDSNRDGNLSMKELERYFAQLGMHDPALVRKIFDTLDVDRDGMLSFSEFSSGTLMLFKDLLEERLHALFLKHDPSGDQALDLAEAKDFLDDALVALDRSTVPGAGKDALEAVMAQGRQSGGKITYDELRTYILGPSGASSRASTAQSRSRAR